MTDQNEYHLTEDELGMLQTFQEEVDEAQRQANALLTRIIKYRKLPNGMWAVYTDLAKLHEFVWRVAKELQDRRVAESQTKGTP